ncbi:MAG: hypothetical protein ACI93L_003267 [Cyclobacteriaceae bacterium]|jgi:hypothetical protein
MKKFFKHIFIFTLFSTLIYALIVILWIHNVSSVSLRKNGLFPMGNKGFLNTRLEEVDTVKNIDLLFLGSSHAYRGFDSRIFELEGINTFNLGSPSQTPTQTEVLIARYLDQLNPKVVIYEVYPSIFQNDGVESGLDFIANTYLDSEIIKMCFRINHIKIYNALIYDLAREMLHINRDVNTSTDNLTDQYISGGFVATSKTSNLSPINDHMKAIYSGKKWIIQDKQWLAFRNIIKRLKNRNITVLLLQAPVTRDAYQLYTNNYEIDSMFQTLAPYFNLNESMKMDDKFDFMDYHHLNQSGVRKVNNSVLEILSLETSLN